jgi:hypothetical protein
MPSVVFEPATPASERLNTYALDRTATGIRRHNLLLVQNKHFNDIYLKFCCLFLQAIGAKTTSCDTKRDTVVLSCDILNKIVYVYLNHTVSSFVDVSVTRQLCLSPQRPAVFHATEYVRIVPKKIILDQVSHFEFPLSASLQQFSMVTDLSPRG